MFGLLMVLAAVIAATGCSRPAPSPPPVVSVAPESSTSAPPLCRQGLAVGLVFVGPQAQDVARDLRAFVAERSFSAEVIEKPGKVIVLLYRGAPEDKQDLVQRARAHGVEFTIEALVTVDAGCDLHWQLAPGSTPP